MKKKIDKNWYQSKNVRPKTFSLTVARDNNGYRIVRGDIVNEVNQHEMNLQKIDIRDLSADIRAKGGVFAL